MHHSLPLPSQRGAILFCIEHIEHIYPSIYIYTYIYIYILLGIHKNKCNDVWWHHPSDRRSVLSTNANPKLEMRKNHRIHLLMSILSSLVLSITAITITMKIGNLPKREKKKILWILIWLAWTHLVVCPFLSNHYWSSENVLYNLMWFNIEILCYKCYPINC